MRTTELIPVYLDTIPRKIEEGKIYISLEHGVAIHLCACGCLEKTVTDLKPVSTDGWTLTDNNGLVTLRPSIGNFNGENTYHAHYFITDNKIQWC